MSHNTTNALRRTVLKKVAVPAALLAGWSSPVVQSIVLPVHARISGLCEPVAIPGKWQLELFGPAASTSEILFFADGSVDHDYINAWQFSNDEFKMTQGTRWVFIGRYTACDALSGTYVNIFTIPILGNVIVRQGDWHASKLS